MSKRAHVRHSRRAVRPLLPRALRCPTTRDESFSIPPPGSMGQNRMEAEEQDLTPTGSDSLRESHAPAEPQNTPNAATTQTPPLKLRASTVGSMENPRLGHHHRTTSTVPLASANSSQTRSKRISLTFPVQPQDTHCLTDQSIVSPKLAVPPGGVTPEPAEEAGQTGDTNFLTAIAAQERKVLELKEELRKAETELNALKRQWAHHEAAKKRDDIRRVTKLQTLPASPATTEHKDEENGASAWVLQGMERRKAMLANGKTSNRRVFSSSRHTRTLSLLSPENKDAPTFPNRQSLPRRKDSLSGTTTLDDTRAVEHRQNSMPRSATTPELSTSVLANDRQEYFDGNREQTIDREQIIKTGKKMASDFRNGLWTFFEDLRQATVGDEAVQEHVGNNTKRTSSVHTQRPARKQGSRGSLRPSSRGSARSKSSNPSKNPSPDRRRESDGASQKTSNSGLPDLANPAFWSEHGITPQPTTPASSKKTSAVKRDKSPRPSSATSSDAWDAWGDSPQEHRSSDAGSEVNTLPSTVSDCASPRASLEASHRDPIPWPSLSKIRPSSLRRTASHLMSEWEKSLTPSPGKEFTGEEDFGGWAAGVASAEIDDGTHATNMKRD